ncbi:hypothetical protein IKQ21_03805, partial [bacterium]|nr:hypothetical protein [bacterium]
MENLEQIKKAIEVEVKYKYINITGKTKSFSSFICSELRKEIKTSKNPKWKILLEHFERYSMDTMPQRKNSLSRLIKAIKADIESKDKINTEGHDKKITLQSDIMY